MELCGERNVAISFLSERGKFYARVQGPVSGNVLLRREQYRRADSEEASTAIARAVVIAKIANCRTVLLRGARDRPEAPQAADLEAAAQRLARLLDDLRQPAPLEAVRGLEGDAARTYFGVFDHLITAQKEDFFFAERSRRPPLDNVNALLSFFYTLLAHDVTAGLESVGLDPAVGYLHRDRPGRPSLALDLMEEFRPILADRLALSLINRQQIRGKGFRKTETGAVMMDDATRKEVLVAYQKRKQEEIQHPFLGETVEVGLLPFVQAMLLARHLRGDLDGYPPFFWK
jgi:CRISPR-associated protein Cas1